MCCCVAVFGGGICLKRHKNSPFTGGSILGTFGPSFAPGATRAPCKNKPFKILFFQRRRHE